MLYIYIISSIGDCFCWRPVLSDHHLWDVPGVEGLVFNNKFTYLKLYDVTWDFELAEWYDNTWKSQCHDKLQFAEYSKLKHNVNVILVTSLYNMLTVVRLGVPSGQEGIRGVRRQLKPIATSKALFLHCSIILYCVFGRGAYIPPCASPAHAGGHLLSWLTQGWTVAQLVRSLNWCNLLILWTDCSWLIHSTDTAIYLDQSHPMGLFVWS